MKVLVTGASGLLRTRICQIARVVPVLVAFIAIIGIGAWIGWTMAATPPPKPIEEIKSTEEETKSAESKEP